jgi:hypothetical protein
MCAPVTSQRTEILVCFRCYTYRRYINLQYLHYRTLSEYYEGELSFCKKCL